MNFHTTCLICNSRELKELTDYKEYYLCQCQSCSFVFTKRIPSEQELIQHYEGYGRNDYLSPITIRRYHELLDEFEKYRKTNKIIDVGCGIGYFLEIAKERGWEVYGTEYTDKAMEICGNKGISMKQGVLDPNNYSPESFDIITSFEVLEHINNPQEELASFYKILRTGGLVYFTTPNFNSLLRYRLKGFYDVICYPEHLSYYAPKTITKAFKNSGFTRLKVLTTGISLTRLRRGKNKKTGNNKPQEQLISKSSSDEILRNKIENKKHLQYAKSIVNWVLTFFGVGDSLKGYFVKR